MRRVLTVDDSASMRALVLETLQEAGYEVTQAKDGQEGFELAQRGGFDLILADVNMPRLDGISMVKQIKELPAYRTVPVLMLTTEINPEKKAKAKEAGASGWLVKPFDPDKLIATVKRVLP